MKIHTITIEDQGQIIVISQNLFKKREIINMINIEIINTISTQKEIITTEANHLKSTKEEH